MDTGPPGTKSITPPPAMIDTIRLLANGPLGLLQIFYKLVSFRFSQDLLPGLGVTHSTATVTVGSEEPETGS